jgi:hypothetical protein
MNPHFVEVMNVCISKIIDPKFISGGYSTMAQDAVTDITQHCDKANLK